MECADLVVELRLAPLALALAGKQCNYCLLIELACSVLTWLLSSPFWAMVAA